MQVVRLYGQGIAVFLPGSLFVILLVLEDRFGNECGNSRHILLVVKFRLDLGAGSGDTLYAPVVFQCKSGKEFGQHPVISDGKQVSCATVLDELTVRRYIGDHRVAANGHGLEK